MKEYNKNILALARTKRKNMTPWERKLWYKFLRRYKVKFRRQEVIGNYIADFYCPEARLIVELDGSGHYSEEQKEKDKIRTENLEKMGYKVIRICNLDIDKNFQGACQFIANSARKYHHFWETESKE